MKNTETEPDEPNLTGRAYAGCCGHGGQRHQKIFLPAPPSLIFSLPKEPKLHGEHADHSCGCKLERPGARRLKVHP